MQSYLHLMRKLLKSGHIYELLLGLLWVVGLLFGFLLANHLSEAVFTMMRMAAQTPVSIVGLIIVIYFPLFLSVVALKISKPVLILPIAFFKALLYGFSTAAIMISFRDSGWLVVRLLLFSETIMVVVLLWFWFRNLYRRTNTFRKDIIVCFLIATLVFFADIYAVSPFLVSLFHYY